MIQQILMKDGGFLEYGNDAAQGNAEENFLWSSMRHFGRAPHSELWGFFYFFQKCVTLIGHMRRDGRGYALV